MKKAKLLDIHAENDTLSEVEVFAKLISGFSIALEPQVPILLPKNLDGLGELNSEESLFEIKTIYDENNFRFGATTIGLDKSRVKSKIISTFEDQLFSGKRDPKIPIILILNLSHSVIDEYQMYDTIFGELQMTYTINKNTGQVVNEYPNRKTNGIYQIPDMDIFTAIIYYKTYNYGTDWEGTIFKAPTGGKNNLSDQYFQTLLDSLY